MQKFAATIGAYVRSYADIEFEATNENEALAAAIARFKTNDRDIVYHETDCDCIALPSVVSIQRLPDHKTVIEGHDFALTEDDARDLHAQELLNIVRLVAASDTEIDQLKERAANVLAEINAAYRSDQS